MKALLINCSLKRSPHFSNTGALMAKAATQLKELGADIETIRFADYEVRSGNSSDEGNGDQWPEILEKVKVADILIIGAPVGWDIWLPPPKGLSKGWTQFFTKRGQLMKIPDNILRITK